MIIPDATYVMVQIDEQCGYIDRRVSRSNFEFINGTVFSIDFKDLPELKVVENPVKNLVETFVKKSDF